MGREKKVLRSDWAAGALHLILTISLPGAQVPSAHLQLKKLKGISKSIQGTWVQLESHVCLAPKPGFSKLLLQGI